MDSKKQVERIRSDFNKSKKILIAIGDETRQAIIMVLMGTGCKRLRVGEITAGTHLSRPAVSHHLGILKDCGLISLNKQGTKNYYSLNIGEEFQNLISLVNNIAQFKSEHDNDVRRKEEH